MKWTLYIRQYSTDWGCVWNVNANCKLVLVYNKKVEDGEDKKVDAETLVTFDEFL